MEKYGRRIIFISIIIILLSIIDFIDNNIITLFNLMESSSFEEIEDFVRTFLEISLIFWVLLTGRKIIHQFHDQQDQYQRLVQYSPEAIIVHGRGKILYINDAGVRLFGTNSPNNLINRDLIDFVHLDSINFVNSLREKLNKLPSIHHNHHVKIKRVDGVIVDLEFTSTLIDFNGEPAREIIARDITIQKKEAEIIQRLAYEDALTGLPNRRFFFDKLNDLVTDSKKNNDIFGVLFIDLDGFKAVNDTLGHEGGDVLLIKVSERLNNSVSSKDTVARLAGDEFMILLPNASQSECETVANIIIESLQSPISIYSNRVRVTPSIGIALYPHHSDEAYQLLKNADTAMYKAKKRGKNNYQVFS